MQENAQVCAHYSQLQLTVRTEMNNEIQNITSAVNVIKTAILQSQTHTAKAVNQEMLALYFGIGRFISAIHATGIGVRVCLPELANDSEVNCQDCGDSEKAA